MQYRPEIDGLRAVAVVPVILFHAGFSAFSGGYVGVDVFFVVSGFLITTIILDAQAKGRFSLLDFYERRARRILPALFLVILVSIPVAWVLLLPTDMKEFAQSILASATFSSNLYFWFRADYFDGASELKPLLHTWSLAIEEQYYLGFPLILMALRARKAILPVLLLIFVGSLAWSQYLVDAAPISAFYLIQSRAWELMAGSLAAFYVLRSGLPKGNDALGLLGIVLILASVFAYDPTTPFPGVAALAPVLGTVLILLFATEGTRSGGLLSLPVFTGIGLVSYSAYLWHQPVFAFARHAEGGGELSTPVLLALIAFVFVLAWLSWRFVETPFRNRQRMGRWTIFGLSAAGCAGLAAFGALGHLQRGFSDRYPDARLTVAQGFAMSGMKEGYCFYNVNRNAKLEVGAAGHDCPLGDPAAPAGRILLIGDSFAAQYEPFWDEVGKSLGLGVNAVTTNWCYPAQTENFPGPVSDRAYRQCLSNRIFLAQDLGAYDAIVLGGYWSNVSKVGLLDDVTDLLTSLEERGEAPVIVMPNPTAYVRRSVEAVVFGASDAPIVDEKGEAYAVAANGTLAGAARGKADMRFIERDALFAGDVTEEGIPYSLDGLHISVHGAKKAAERFLASDASAFLRDLRASAPD